MAFIAPPVYTPDGLVAPWRLRVAARIPVHLVHGTPAGGMLRLVVAGQAIAERSAAPRAEDGVYVLELDEWFTSIEWPQRKYIPVRDEAMENVTETTVDSGPFYTAVYAGGGGRICIADVCEDTDRDGDGIIEVVYLARPGERVTVHCEQPCTVRAWRATMLSRLDAYIEAVLNDANGAQLGSWRFPVQTLEAPVFAPEGFTIRIDPKITGIRWPWCGVDHPGFKPSYKPPFSDTMDTYIGIYGNVLVYDVDVATVEHERCVPFGSRIVRGGIATLGFYGGIIDWQYSEEYNAIVPVNIPARVIGLEMPCDVNSIPSSITVLNFAALNASIAVVLAGESRENVIITKPWGNVRHEYLGGRYVPRYVPPKYSGFTLRANYAFCLKRYPMNPLRSWSVAGAAVVPNTTLRVECCGRTIYSENDELLMGDRSCHGTVFVAHLYTHAVIVEVRYPYGDECDCMGYGAKVVRLPVRGANVYLRSAVTLQTATIRDYCVPA